MDHPLSAKKRAPILSTCQFLWCQGSPGGQFQPNLMPLDEGLGDRWAAWPGGQGWPLQPRGRGTRPRKGPHAATGTGGGKGVKEATAQPYQCHQHVAPPPRGMAAPSRQGSQEQRGDSHRPRDPVFPPPFPLLWKLLWVFLWPDSAANKSTAAPRPRAEALQEPAAPGRPLQGGVESWQLSGLGFSLPDCGLLLIPRGKQY